jgi:adenylate kinase family enzyme
MQGPSIIGSSAEGSTGHSVNSESLNHSRWQLDPTSTIAEKILVKQRGEKSETLRFNSERRLIITIIGAPQTGKKILADRIQKTYGVASVCFQTLVQFPQKLEDMKIYGEGKDCKEGSENYVKWFLRSYAKTFSLDAVLPKFLWKMVFKERTSREDCKAGFSIVNFPITSEQCDFYKKHIVGSNVHLPICLDFDEDVVAEGISGSEELRKRNDKYKENKDNLLKKFSNVKVIPLKNESEDDVSKIVMEHIDSELDKLAPRSNVIYVALGLGAVALASLFLFNKKAE